MARSTRNEWSDRVRRWRRSGLTARVFAARENLNPRTLGWWASQLRNEVQPTETFVDVSALVTTAPSAPIEILVSDTVRIRVSAGFDAELLRSVVSALEAR